MTQTTFTIATTQQRAIAARACQNVTQLRYEHPKTSCHTIEV